jgi:hypothetical protein
MSNGVVTVAALAAELGLVNAALLAVAVQL